MQLTKCVYEDLWVQEVKVIFKTLNQDSHILTILSISSKVTEPIITKFHIELPTFICSNSPVHMPNMIKNLSKSSSIEPNDRWSWYLICRIQYSSTAKIVQMITLGWPWHFNSKVKYGKMLIQKISWKVSRFWPKKIGIYSWHIKWLLEDSLVQKVKVIIWPLTQDC